LASIQQEPGTGVAKLAAQAGVSSASVSVQVRRFERDGLVERTIGMDRRRVGLKATPQAARVIRSVQSRRTAWLAERLKRLGPEELDAIGAALQPLARLVDEAD
jgi:DNA-binding MarR family transcriptional regulator